MSLAYRMLGCRAEAEDIVQDAWLRWNASDTASLRQPAAWLTTVVTRLSIDRLRLLQTERAARQNGWLPDPCIEVFAPSAEELMLDGAQLSYGLMLLLERLSPNERAAFLLREAFDCDYAALWVPWLDARRRLTLYVVTRASALAAANAALGRAAIVRLLARIAQHTGSSLTRAHSHMATLVDDPQVAAQT